MDLFAFPRSSFGVVEPPANNYNTKIIFIAIGVNVQRIQKGLILGLSFKTVETLPINIIYVIR